MTTLYADVTLWVKKKWIDYNIPQIYWEIGHPAADYITLTEWWDKMLMIFTYTSGRTLPAR